MRMKDVARETARPRRPTWLSTGSRRAHRVLIAGFPLAFLILLPVILHELPSTTSSSLGARAATAHHRPNKKNPPTVAPRKARPTIVLLGAQQRALGRLRGLGLPIRCGSDRRRVVALTFDDGPGPLTGRTLGLLRRAHATATFFLIGQNVVVRPAIVPAERKLGALGDHTWSHPDLTRLPPTAIAGQLTKTRTAIARAGGGTVQLFRPPYGARNQTVDHVAASTGLAEVLWSIDTRDANGASTASFVATVAHFLKPGAIILMHENKPHTLAALPKVLALLRQRHLTPVRSPSLSR